MAQATGLYLFPFSKYRQVNVRSLVKFLIPGPSKICKKSIVPYGRNKIQQYITGRENQNGASRKSVSLSVFEISPWECSESCEIFNTRTFENCSERREKIQYYVTGRENQNGAGRRSCIFPFSRYRHGNVRSLVKFLIPGPSKICKKSILKNGCEKILYYVTGRENLSDASRMPVSLSVFEISPRERSESCEIFNTRTFENLQKIDCSIRA